LFITTTAIIIMRIACRRGRASEIEQHLSRFSPLTQLSSAGFLFLGRIEE
jgi:hypothetical protein